VLQLEAWGINQVPAILNFSKFEFEFKFEEDQNKNLELEFEI
jgi:hypothetical protein